MKIQLYLINKGTLQAQTCKVLKGKRDKSESVSPIFMGFKIRNIPGTFVFELSNLQKMEKIKRRKAALLAVLSNKISIIAYVYF